MSRIGEHMEVSLQAEKRETRGKNEAGRLRRAGRVPAVLYGSDGNVAREPMAIAVDPKAVLRILHSESGANTIIGLSIAGGDTTRVMIREYQLDPITRHLLHADFYRVAMDKAITVTVPVVVRGEPRGVKHQGGILDFVHRAIVVECLPSVIPEHIEIDVSELMVGQSVRVRDLAPSDRWTPKSDPDLMLVHVIMPKVEEEPAVAVEAAAVAAPAEPEVIKKGKVEKPEEKKEE